MAQIVIEYKGDSTDAIAAIQRVNQKLVEQNEHLRGVKKASKEAAKETEDGFGRTAVASLAQYTVGLASIGTAVGLVKKAFADLNAEKERASEFNKQAEGGLSGLALAAGGDSAKMTAYRDQARKLFGQGGQASLGAAADVVGALARSGGRMEDIQMYAKLFPAIKDTGVLATGAADLQTAMGGRAGTQREIVSRALMAAQGTEESPEELLKATGKSAAFFRGIGARPEEITSAIAVLSDVAGGPMGAARWMKTLGPEITKATPLLRGQGLAAALSDKASIELSKKLTGTSLEAYQILRENQPQIEEMNQRQRWAEQTDYVGQLTSTIEGVPEIRAERLRRSQAAKKALAMTDEGTMRSVSLAAADARTTQMKERGSPGLARWGEKQLSDFERYSAVDEMYLNREMVTGRQPGIAQRLFNITHNWGVAGMYAAQPPRDDLGKDLLKVMDRIEKNTRTTKVNAPVIRVDVE